MSDFNFDTPGGDPDWLQAHSELVALHREKSSTYGTDEDPLENFTGVAAITCSAPEVYVVQRMIEKLIRAVNMLAAGEPEAIEEYMDCASLALCAEALRRRRL